MPSRILLALVMLLLVSPGLSQAQEKKENADQIDFAKQIKPILERSCIKCHGEKKSEGNLKLHTQATALKGGDSGPAVVPKDPDKSLIVERVSLPKDDLLHMPAEGDALSKAEIDLLRKWIQQGAAWPKDLALTPGSATPKEAPKGPGRPLNDAEKAAIAKIQELGGQVLELAQNDPRLVVNFHLADGKVTDDHLVPVEALNEWIYELNLRGTDITDAGLAHLKSQKALTRLHLEKTKVTDEGLKQLTGLTNLEYLNVYGTAVTDAAVDLLTSLSNLKKVYIWQSKVTVNGVRKLKASLPEAQVIPDLVAEFNAKEKAVAEARQQAEQAKKQAEAAQTAAQQQQNAAEAARKEAEAAQQEAVRLQKIAEELAKSIEAAKKRAEQVAKEVEQAKKQADEAQKQAQEAQQKAKQAAEQVEKAQKELDAFAKGGQTS